MATQALTDCTIFLNEYDLSADVNSVDWDWEADEVDATTFGSGGNQELKAGIRKSKVMFNTFYNTATGQVEPVFTSLKGTTGNILTVTPNGTDGDRAIFCRGLAGGVKMLGKVGDMAPLTGKLSTSSAEGLVEGYLMLPKLARTSSSTPSPLQLGAVASTQTVYAALHVFSASGTSPTLDLTVYSDDNSGLSSATGRISFTQATGATSEVVSVAGPITDDYWSVGWSIGGSDTPTFSFAVSVAIA